MSTRLDHRFEEEEKEKGLNYRKVRRESLSMRNKNQREDDDEVHPFSIQDDGPTAPHRQRPVQPRARNSLISKPSAIQMVNEFSDSDSDTSDDVDQGDMEEKEQDVTLDLDDGVVSSDEEEPTYFEEIKEEEFNEEDEYKQENQEEEEEESIGSEREEKEGGDGEESVGSECEEKTQSLVSRRPDRALSLAKEAIPQFRSPMKTVKTSGSLFKVCCGRATSAGLNPNALVFDLENE